MRPCDSSSPLASSKFQSTHPLRDATADLKSSSFIKVISIHAPLTGCDSMIYHVSSSRRNFNPRTPYGMRRLGARLATQRRDFNPRTPYGMRRPVSAILLTFSIFQSTHPLRDATVSRRFLVRSIEIFQSTHPLRDATMIFMKVMTSYLIFQSTHPLRDATQIADEVIAGQWDFNPRTPYGMRPRS